MKNCIHCNSTNIVKFGKIDSEQQYFCKSCNKHFRKNSNPKRGLIIDDKKYCNGCNDFKPLNEFLYSEGKPRSKCKICYLKKNNFRYKKYELTESKFNEILVLQNHKCKICDSKFKSNKKTFIDHSHNTGKIRGLLCPSCNTLLGQCKDDISILQSAIQYLKSNM